MLSTTANTTDSLVGMASSCNVQGEKEMIVNVTVFVVRVWVGQYREELILNVTVFVVRALGGQ